jgi:serine protease
MKLVRVLSVPLAALMLLMCSHTWAQTLRGPPQRLIVKWATAAATVPAGQIGSASRTMSDMQATFGITMQPMRTLATGGQVMQLAQPMPRADLQNLVAMMSQDPAVDYVHEDVLLQTALTTCAPPNCLPTFVPNDPLYTQQFHLFDPSDTLTSGKFNFEWTRKSGRGVRVAVVDTGFTQHPDLAANLLPGYDFISDPFIANDGDGRDASALDPGNFTLAGECGPDQLPAHSTWHGTHVAGLIAAASDNSLGVAGVARNAKVVPVRAIGRCGGLLSDIAEAVIWAAGGAIAGVPANPYPAQIINLSLSGPGKCDRTTQQVIDITRALGAVIVVAAGNNSAAIENFIPASCRGVIVVGALDRSGMSASYSNFDYNCPTCDSPRVSILAFGGGTTSNSGVLSTANAGTTTPGPASYELKTGTSMATAIVSGTVALMIEDRPGNDWLRIYSALRLSGIQNCTPISCGARILSGGAALTLPLDPTQEIPPVFDLPPCWPFIPCGSGYGGDY